MNQERHKESENWAKSYADKYAKTESELTFAEWCYQQGRADAITELKSLLRCRNYRGCAAGKGCDGVCSIDSDICKSCENFGIPYSLLEQKQKGAENE